LDLLSEAISGSFFLVLRISGPFIVYAVVLNFAFGLVNKLTPQIPVYFVCLPFVIFGGLLLLYFAAGDFLNVFQNGMATWLQLI
jgi:flagellar biosynthetic protein FliR